MIQQTNHRYDSTVIPTENVLVSIIGGGASAVLLLRAIAKRLDNSSSGVEFHLFDATGEWGRGYAYKTKSNVYLLNTSAHSMSVDEEDRNDFLIWLKDRPSGLGQIPRSLYGDYLQQRLAESVSKLAATGHRVHLHSKYVKCLKVGSRHKIITSDFELEVDHCIIATGGSQNNPMQEIKSDRYIQSALDENKLKQIPRGSSVGLLGAGQSAIDVCLFLESRQVVDRYTLVSRGGVLPRVKSDLSSASTGIPLQQPTSVAQAKTGILRKIRWQNSATQKIRSGSFRAMEADLKRALRTKPSWQTAMSEMTPWINTIWGDADLESRARFLTQDFRSLHHLRSAIPPTTAKKFLSLHQQARLEVVSGPYRIRCIDSHFEYIGKDMRRTFDYLVNATGIGAASFSGMLSNDISSFNVNVNSRGGLNVEPRSMRLLCGNDKPVRGLYAIGYPSIGNVLIVNSIELIRQSATVIARTIFPNSNNPKDITK